MDIQILNEDMIVAVVVAAIATKPEKIFLGLQQDSNSAGLCVSTAVLYHLSYEDPYIGSRPFC